MKILSGENAEQMGNMYNALRRMGVPKEIARDMTIQAMHLHHHLEASVKETEKFTNKIADTLKAKKEPWEE